jgi:hypothetical protein
MPNVNVDGAPFSAGEGPETLGDLLTAVDERCARQGRIVTAIRLDGDDEPAFREAHVVARRLATLATVEISTGTAVALALECLSEAGVALLELASAAEDVAWRLRAGEVRGGNRDLVAITQGIGTALTITGAASLGLGVDLGTCETPHGTLAAVASRASRHLEAVISAQVAGDWTAVADALDAGLVPALRAWGDICRGLELGEPA